MSRADPLKVLKRKLKDQDDSSEVSYDLPATVKDLEVQSLVPMRRGGGQETECHYHVCIKEYAVNIINIIQ